jgi:MFS family permease
MLLWSGQVVSSLGTQISQYAFPLLLLAISGSPLSAGLSFALHSLPYLLLSLPAGGLIDRWNRKYVMIICDTGRALCLASIPIAAFFGLLTPWLLYAASFLEGVLFTFFSIAEVSCLPRIVSKQQLPAANTQNIATESITIIIGPTLCGLLYSLSRSIPFLADAFSYAISVLSLCWIKIPLQEKRPAQPRHLWQDIKEGIAWIWHHPLIRFLAVISAGKNFIGAGFLLLIIVLAQRQHFSPFFITSIFTIGGIGSILGTLLAPFIQKKMSFGTALIGISWLLTLLMALYLLAFTPLFLGLITACVFICTMN